MSRSGIIIKNRIDGRGIILPEREGCYTFNRLPFLSMTSKKDQLGLNPPSNKIIIKSKKLLEKIKKRRNLKKKKYEIDEITLAKFRKLKLDQQFWKKNENPAFKEYNKKDENDESNVKELDNDNLKNITLNSKKISPKKLKALRVKSAIPFKKKICEEKKNNSVNEKDIKNELKRMDDIKEVQIGKDNKDIKESDDKELKEKEIKDPLLDDNNEEKDNIDDVINFLNGLDYDKYCKDMEIREALNLLKSKIDKEIEEKKAEEEKNKIKVNLQGVENDENKKEKGQEKLENQENKELILPEIIDQKLEQKSKEIIDEEKLKKEEEIKKYKIAEQIAKTDQMKAVHSVNSIKKLLQREGLDKVSFPLKIENPLKKIDEYEYKNMSFLD